ncbi:hypothetical protein J1N35_022939 [Gossypium stocksii]|uniref:Disease resistance protein At4g27190-like leucine-rich repeats domain-containing protein n=1 Tax=Gossypium stocksii TaxID=47602 RepID=A0A9D3VHQ0_9ROSI|nr:hypothetical protein J1N35_022939 [Gossypium stocksii]
MEMLYDPITQGCPHLKHLEISNVSDMKFVINPKMLVSSLESLSLWDLMNLEAICDGQLKAESFGRLRSVRVCHCNMLKNLFSFTVAKGLRQLEKISVEWCANMRELIKVEKEEMGEDDILEFTQLRYLTLTKLPEFNGMWNSFATWVFDKKVLFPALEELHLYEVNGIEKKWHDDQLLTVSLTCLELSNCHKLKYVFTSSMVKSFANRKTLIVSNCDEMEGIIEGILDITECPVLSASHFDTASIGNNISLDPNVPQLQHLFSAKVLFPATLGELRLYEVNGIEKIWHDDLLLTVSLTSLELTNCHKLKCVFTSSMVKSFANLERLEVADCDEMEGIIEGILGGEERSNDSIIVRLKIWICPVLSAFHFDTASSGNNISLDLNVPQLQHLFRAKVSFPALEDLYLKFINGIEKIWHDDPLLTMSCGVQNLTKLIVQRCNKLKCAYPSSMVENFVHLKRLVVVGCDEIEDIIEGILGGEERSNNSISLFPKLVSLQLNNLPNLKTFCRGINPIEFPFLRKLDIKKCPVLSAFHFDTASIGNISLHPNIPQPQYLFNAKIT